MNQETSSTLSSQLMKSKPVEIEVEPDILIKEEPDEADTVGECNEIVNLEDAGGADAAGCLQDNSVFPILQHIIPILIRGGLPKLQNNHEDSWRWLYRYVSLVVDRRQRVMQILLVKEDKETQTPWLFIYPNKFPCNHCLEVFTDLHDYDSHIATHSQKSVQQRTGNNTIKHDCEEVKTSNVIKNSRASRVVKPKITKVCSSESVKQNYSLRHRTYNTSQIKAAPTKINKINGNKTQLKKMTKYNMRQHQKIKNEEGEDEEIDVVGVQLKQHQKIKQEDKKIDIVSVCTPNRHRTNEKWKPNMSSDTTGKKDTRKSTETKMLVKAVPARHRTRSEQKDKPAPPCRGEIVVTKCVPTRQLATNVLVKAMLTRQKTKNLLLNAISRQDRRVVLMKNSGVSRKEIISRRMRNPSVTKQRTQSSTEKLKPMENLETKSVLTNKADPTTNQGKLNQLVGQRNRKLRNILNATSESVAVQEMIKKSLSTRKDQQIQLGSIKTDQETRQQTRNTRNERKTISRGIAKKKHEILKKQSLFLRKHESRSILFMKATSRRREMSRRPLAPETDSSKMKGLKCRTQSASRLSRNGKTYPSKTGLLTNKPHKDTRSGSSAQASRNLIRKKQQLVKKMDTKPMNDHRTRQMTRSISRARRLCTKDKQLR